MTDWLNSEWHRTTACGQQMGSKYGDHVVGKQRSEDWQPYKGLLIYSILYYVYAILCNVILQLNLQPGVLTTQNRSWVTFSNNITTFLRHYNAYMYTLFYILLNFCVFFYFFLDLTHFPVYVSSFVQHFRDDIGVD